MKCRLLVIFISGISLATFSVLNANSTSNLTAIDDTSFVWIFGTDINGYGCWSLATSKVDPVLQVKLHGNWIVKAKAQLSKDPTYCPNKMYPWMATYHWKVDALGESVKKGSLGFNLISRQYLPNIKVGPLAAGEIFVKRVYRSRQDLIADSGPVVHSPLVQHSPGGVSGGSVSSVSKISGCVFNGIKLYGKVQFVNFVPDMKVQVVNFSPDLKVQKVNFMPTSCGMWQIVNFMPDFKIQLVNFQPDFKIEFVNFMPGLS